MSENPQLRDEMIRLSEQASRMMGSSRLAAAVAGLKMLVLTLDTGVSESVAVTTGGGDSLDVAITLAAADKLSDDSGFLLEDLIAESGPDMILSVQSYKIAVGRLLTSAGYRRKQMRRAGSRPLVWFKPRE